MGDEESDANMDEYCQVGLGLGHVVGKTFVKVVGGSVQELCYMQVVV